MRFVTFIGLNGVGKSTAAAEMERRLADEGLKVQRLSFASPLKSIAGTYLKADKISNRKLLEDFSHDLKGLFGTDIYARGLVNAVDKSADYVIIDDMRYPVEIDAIREVGQVFVIHCQRPSCYEEDKDMALADRDRLSMLLLHMHKTGVKIFENIYACTHLAVENIVESMLHPETINEPQRWFEPKIGYEIFDAQGYTVVTLKFNDGTRRGYVVGKSKDVDRDTLAKIVEDQLIPMWCPHGNISD